MGRGIKITKNASKRSFGGKLIGFESKGEEAYEKRHLKAYLKGKKVFRCGFDLRGEPNYFNVIENWN